MSKLNARARIIQNFEIVLDNGRSHSSIADQPTETSPGIGPTPLELCVMSHAGCYATEESFDVVFKVDAPADRVKRLHELTLKNCPVGILFEKAGVKINYSLKTVKE